MTKKIKEIAEFVNGIVTGSCKTISSVAKIQDAKQGELTFLYLPAYEKYFKSTKASAILVKPGFEKSRSDITYIEVAEPDKAFAKIIHRYFTDEIKLSGIDKSAFVDTTAKVGEYTSIGKNVVISAGCKIGKNVKIFHNTVLMENVDIGDDCLIYPNVTIREKCKVGKRVIVHSGTVIGSDGFGFNKDDKGEYQKVPQIGNVILEDDVELGANVTIDRAAIGSTIIKNGVKLDNLVQIAHNVTIGENTVMSAQTGISGSTTIGKNCMIAGQVGIIGHIDINDNVIIIAQSGVSKPITKPGVYFGSPAKDLKTAKRIEAHIRNLPEYSEKINQLEQEIISLKKELLNKS